MAFSVLSKESEPAEPHPPAPAPAPAKPTKQRAPKPPAPQPPAATAVSATPASISIAPNPEPPLSEPAGGAGWERSQSTLPSVSNTLDEMFSSSVLSKPPSVPTYVDKDKDDGGPPSNPSFSQVSCSCFSVTGVYVHSRTASTLPLPLCLLSSTQAAAS